MPSNRPALKELSSQILSDFSSELLSGSPVQKQTVLYALAQAVSGATHLLYGHLDFMARQMFPDTANEENLLKLGAIYGVKRKEPIVATGTIEITGVEGTPVPSALTLV